MVFEPQHGCYINTFHKFMVIIHYFDRIRLRTMLVMRHLDMVISSKMVEKSILCLMATWELIHVVEDF